MVHGRYADAQSSATRPATLEAISTDRWQLRLEGQLRPVDPAQLVISDRIGSIPRRLQFPDGAEFETPDNDGIDALLEPLHGRSEGWVHALEKRWGVAVAALVGVALVSILFIRFGIPALAGWAAERLPASTDRLIGGQTLQLLDQTVLDASQIDPQRQAQLQNLFTRMTHSLDDGHEYRLEMRAAGRLGANALALPSGIIVITDELVRLAQHDEELQAVLAHEIGHVRGRHSLRQIIMATGVSALAVAVLGDLSSISALASAAPVLLHTKHSRDFEREADDFARQWLQQQGIAASRFDDILCRMASSRGGDVDLSTTFLSTHPATGERARCEKDKP